MDPVWVFYVPFSGILQFNGDFPKGWTWNCWNSWSVSCGAGGQVQKCSRLPGVPIKNLGRGKLEAAAFGPSCPGRAGLRHFPTGITQISPGFPLWVHPSAGELRGVTGSIWNEQLCFASSWKRLAPGEENPGWKGLASIREALPLNNKAAGFPEGFVLLGTYSRSKKSNKLCCSY